MKSVKSRLMVVLVVASLIAGSMSCGYILHPERKGTKSGKIDVPILLMDCAWLVLGFGVVGVVALVVDFYTGCIYESSATVEAQPGQKVAFRLTDPSPAKARLEVTLADKEGRPIAYLLGRDVAAGESVGEVTLSLPDDLALGEYRLTVAVNGAPSTYWQVKIVN
jgi:hypothetical protein